MENDWQAKIDKWLSTLDRESLDEIWGVVVELKREQLLMESNYLNIPLKRFRNKVLDLGTAEKIFELLSQKDIIAVGAEIEDKITRQTIDITWADDHQLFYSPIGMVKLSDGFEYIYIWLENKNNQIKSKRDFNWQPFEEEKRGVLVLPNGERMIFWSGNFGIINLLFKNIEHDVKRDLLRDVIVNNKQGSRKNPKQINISGWIYGLKRRRPKLFEYFDIEFYPPDSYRLFRKRS